MKFLFNKMICLFVSAAWVNLAFAQLEKKEILDQAERSIYRVDIRTGFDDSDTILKVGTGFFISEDLFVTAFHMVNDIEDIHQISLHPKKEDKSLSIKIKSIEYASLYADLAILRTQTKSPYFLKQGESSLNEKLTLIGYPQGQFRKWENIDFTTRSVPYDPQYRIQFLNTEENAGAGGISGSPFLNSKGEFVGVALRIIIEDNTVFYSFIPSEFIDKILNKEVGQKCLDFSCIKEEHERVRNHIETYAYNQEEIPLDEETFFHLSPEMIFQISDKDTILSYLNRGAVQDQELEWFFMNALYYLKKNQIIDLYTYLDLLKQVGEQGNRDVQRYLHIIYSEGIDVEKDDTLAHYWLLKWLNNLSI